MPAPDLIEVLRAQLQGTYRVERELGGGGMSRVFIAEEIALGRRVVLKVLAPDLAHVLSAERFEREIRVAARLQHPHIVPLLTAGRAGDALYYTMPLVEGESLRSRIDRHGELPVDEALRLFREVADALAYAHRENVVHRDIKPDNILLSHGHAMVTDFGVARAVEEAVGGGTLTHTGMAVGTPAYMAPEQAAASPTDHRADIYASGLVAYEMLAGQPPFRGATPQALVAAHMTQAPPRLLDARPSVPGQLADIVHRCLEKRPADRFQTATELASTLDRVAISTTADRSPAATMSRRSLLAAVAGLGLVTLGFGAGYAAFRARPRTSPSYRRLTFRRGMIRTARFGPDFQTVLYGAVWDDDVCRTYTVRPESPESSALNLPPASPVAVSSTGEIALVLGPHTRGIMPYGTLARVPISGGVPRELYENVKYADWSPDGRDIAIVRSAGDRDQLEFPAGTAIAQPESPDGGFSFVRVSPDGQSLAAFELTFRSRLVGRVVMFDRSGKRQATSGSYSNVFGLAWYNDEVWFTAADELPLFRNAVYAMTRTGKTRIVARVPGNTSLHDIAPDGTLLIARTDDRGGIAVRAPDESAERDLSWLDGTNLADISRDGRNILFYEYGVGGGRTGSTYLRGTDGSPAVRLSDGIGHALSPDGQLAIVQVEGEAHFNVVPIGAGESSRIERAGLMLLQARWHPDGAHIVVRARAGQSGARLYMLDVVGNGTRQLTPDSDAIPDSGWALSPDGTSVAVSNEQEVLLYSTSSADVQRAVGLPRGSRVIGWIEGGLLVSGNPAAGGVVHRVDPVSGQRVVWADIKPQDPAGIMNLNLNSLVTTPDGRAYGYTWHRAISDLFLVDGLT